MVGLPGVTLKENYLSPRSHQLPIGRVQSRFLPIHARMLTGLKVCRPWASNRACRCAGATLTLALVASMIVPESWGGCVM